MQSPVEEIKEKLSVVDVVSSYIEVKKAGSSFKACCPFHNEKTPSFSVSPERGTFHCFGCDEGGDMFTFVEKMDGVDFKGALQILADKAGVTLQKKSLKESKLLDAMYKLTAYAATVFQANLTKDTPAFKYLLGRGLSEESIREWQLGVVGDEWRFLKDKLQAKKIPKDLSLKAGLLKSKEGGDCYDTFRNRILFPIFNTSGKVIAFSGRIQGDGEPKYLNSPDTPIFNKSETLYGLDRAKDTIRRQGRAYVVEGQMDLLMMHQVGVVNTVATSGTALTLEHLKRLLTIAPAIVFVFDGDKAGVAATVRGGKIALELGMSVFVAVLPEDTDPADLALKGEEVLKKVLEKPTPLITFVLEQVLNEESDPQERIKRVSKEILPLITSLPREMEKAHFVSEVSRRLHIKEEVIWRDMNKVPSEQRESLSPDSPEPRKDSMSRERMLFGLFARERALGEKAHFDVSDLETRLKEVVGEGVYRKMVERALKGEAVLLKEIETYCSTRNCGKELAEDLLLAIEKEFLKREMKRVQDALRVGGDGESLLLKEYQQLIEKQKSLQGKD